VRYEGSAVSMCWPSGRWRLMRTSSGFITSTICNNAIFNAAYGWTQSEQGQRVWLLYRKLSLFRFTGRITSFNLI